MEAFSLDWQHLPSFVPFTRVPQVTTSGFRTQTSKPKICLKNIQPLLTAPNKSSTKHLPKPIKPCEKKNENGTMEPREMIFTQTPFKLQSLRSEHPQSRPSELPNPVWKDVKACSTLPSSALRRSVGLNENLGCFFRKPPGKQQLLPTRRIAGKNGTLVSCNCWVVLEIMGRFCQNLSLIVTLAKRSLKISRDKR